MFACADGGQWPQCLEVAVVSITWEACGRRSRSAPTLLPPRNKSPDLKSLISQLGGEGYFFRTFKRDYAEELITSLNRMMTNMGASRPAKSVRRYLGLEFSLRIARSILFSSTRDLFSAVNDVSLSLCKRLSKFDQVVSAATSQSVIAPLLSPAQTISMSD
jgi:hypothetical protein